VNTFQSFTEQFLWERYVEEYGILGGSALYLRENATFRRNILPRFLGSKIEASKKPAESDAGLILDVLLYVED
jgi:hypothetical protein